MLEAPEAKLIARQLDVKLSGRTFTVVVAGFSPHKFAWFHGDPEKYQDIFGGLRIDRVRSVGGMVEIIAGDLSLVMSDGVNIRYHAPGEDIPGKHQFLAGFDDESCMIFTVRMYGGIFYFREGDAECGFTPYYTGARDKPQVMSGDFTPAYFMSLADIPENQKKSAKAFLATGQTIPGLGNGVLQDILYKARIHPKTKLEKLNFKDKENLYQALRSTMDEIYQKGGRCSEKDIYGRPGGYFPYLCKDTAGQECPACGQIIMKESYLGGSIYYCPGCQKYIK